jgi:hypothetical protein
MQSSDDESPLEISTVQSKSSAIDAWKLKNSCAASNRNKIAAKRKELNQSIAQSIQASKLLKKDEEERKSNDDDALPIEFLEQVEKEAEANKEMRMLKRIAINQKKKFSEEQDESSSSEEDEEQETTKYVDLSFLHCLFVCFVLFYSKNPAMTVCYFVADKFISIHLSW